MPWLRRLMVLAERKARRGERVIRQLPRRIVSARWLLPAMLIFFGLYAVALLMYVGI